MENINPFADPAAIARMYPWLNAAVEYVSPMLPAAIPLVSSYVKGMFSGARSISYAQGRRSVRNTFSSSFSPGSGSRTISSRGRRTRSTVSRQHTRSIYPLVASMPRGKYYKKRRRYMYRKRPAGISKASVNQLIDKRLMIKSDDKIITTGGTGRDSLGNDETPNTSFTTTESYQQLFTVVSQGDGVTQRNGNEIRIKSLQIKLHLLRSAASASEIMRVIVARVDMDTSTRSWSNILKSTTNTYLSLYTNTLEESVQGSYQILHDETFVLDTGTHSEIIRNLSFKFPKGLTCRYHGSNSSDGISGALTMIVMSSNPSTSSVGTYNYNARLKYVE